jgi:hypothetical protein
MRTSAAGMSPAKIAIADMVTIAATAGSGSRKNAIGTSSAVASVAVSPGMAPTNMPYTAAASTTTSRSGSASRARASPTSSSTAPS